MTFDLSMLRAGDCCLYFDRRSVVDWGIAIKTGAQIAHIEIYTGSGMSVASRNGIGVNRYSFRPEGLVCVRRPRTHVDLWAAEQWFRDVRGEGYDFKGLLCFWLAVREGSRRKMFCSEFALRWYRHATVQPFNPAQDADRTSPRDFWLTNEFETIRGGAA